MKHPKVILITGASSGIGEALALEYATDGATLVLIGRDLDRLDAVAAKCRDGGAEVRLATIDVTEAKFFGQWLEGVDSTTPIDLVIANAGISGGTGGGGEPDEQVRRIFAINVDGVFNTLHPLIPRMSKRRRGQIAIMSSLAAFRGYPGAPAYCASKAAVRSYGESLRGSLAADGVEVSVICPGFIKTPMTAVNPFKMPFLMEADRAARIIKRGLARNRARIAFPLPTYFAAWLTGALAPSLTDPWLNRTPKKPDLAAAKADPTDQLP